MGSLGSVSSSRIITMNTAILIILGYAMIISALPTKYGLQFGGNGNKNFSVGGNVGGVNGNNNVSGATGNGNVDNGIGKLHFYWDGQPNDRKLFAKKVSDIINRLKKCCH